MFKAFDRAAEILAAGNPAEANAPLAEDTNRSAEAAEGSASEAGALHGTDGARRPSSSNDSMDVLLEAIGSQDKPFVAKRTSFSSGERAAAYDSRPHHAPPATTDPGPAPSVIVRSEATPPVVDGVGHEGAATDSTDFSTPKTKLLSTTFIVGRRSNRKTGLLSWAAAGVAIALLLIAAAALSNMLSTTSSVDGEPAKTANETPKETATAPAPQPAVTEVSPDIPAPPPTLEGVAVRAEDLPRAVGPDESGLNPAEKDRSGRGERSKPAPPRERSAASAVAPTTAPAPSSSGNRPPGLDDLKPEIH